MTDGDSPLEQCGFVGSFVIFPLGSLYILWLVVPDFVLTEQEHSEIKGTKSSSFGVLALNLSTSLLCLFIGIPLLYGMLNRAISPRDDSIHTIIDDYTRPLRATGEEFPIEKEHVPEICDYSIAKVNVFMDEKLMK